MCHDISVGEKRKREMDAKKEINWQIAWYDGLDVLLFNTKKHSFSVFVRLKNPSRLQCFKHKMFALLKPNPVSCSTCMTTSHSLAQKKVIV